MFGPPPPQATPIRRPQPVRPSLRNRQFMSPLSTSAQSFQIDKVLKNDPKARQLGEDTDPDTELGRFYKDAAELVTAGGFSPEEALEKVVALLNDPSFVNENLSSLARHEGGVERGQLVATPYFLAREKGAPPYVVDKRTGEQFLLRGGGGLADAPRALKGVVESLMPGTTSLTADPPGSTVKELQERLGGKLVRRGSPIDALGAAGTIMGQGGLHLRVTGPGLAKYHAALAPETLLQWLRRAEASKHIR
jgi:hypothetical protein